MKSCSAIRPNSPFRIADGALKPEFEVGEVKAIVLPLISDGDCIAEEVARLTREAGDPETLDPSTVEFLPVKSWSKLDAFGRRLALAQAITTKALFTCT